jgi:hypothetical protein
VHPVSGEKLQVRIADSEVSVQLMFLSDSQAQKQWKKQMKVVEQDQQHFGVRRASVPR